MSVTVAGLQIYSLSQVSELSRRVLRFIDGGPQWLDWAVRERQARYRFNDETEMLAAIQPGLHGMPFILLPRLGLLVSPVKLMTLSLSELGTLELAEGGNASATTVARVKQVLAVHGLVTQADLDAGTAYLDELGVAGAPLLQAMGLNERIAILDLVRNPSSPDLSIDYRKEAAAFAADQGRTPLEFADYFRAYLVHIDAVSTLSDTPEQRSAAVQAALDALAPLMFGALDCPRVDQLVAPWEVEAAIGEWSLMGRRLGFARVSDGIRQIVTDTALDRREGADAEQIVSAYLSGATALLASSKLGRGVLWQDGATCTFTVVGEGEEAIATLCADGVIALGGYRPVAAEPAVAPAPAPRSTREKK